MLPSPTDLGHAGRVPLRLRAVGTPGVARPTERNRPRRGEVDRDLPACRRPDRWAGLSHDLPRGARDSLATRNARGPRLDRSQCPDGAELPGAQWRPRGDLAGWTWWKRGLPGLSPRRAHRHAAGGPPGDGVGRRASPDRLREADGPCRRNRNLDHDVPRTRHGGPGRAGSGPRPNGPKALAATTRAPTPTPRRANTTPKP